MSATHVLNRSTASKEVSDLRTARWAGMAVAILGLAAAATVVVGVRLPWISTFQGLLKQGGWGSRNGDILVGLAVVGAALSLLQLAKPSAVARWLLALTGFGAMGFAGYLIVQLYDVTAQADSMTFLHRESGLYVVAAGAAAMFATIFLPMPGAASTAASPRASGRPLNSSLRFLVVPLALIAGLSHVPVTPEHLREAPYIGVLFIVLTVVCVLLAAAVLVSDSAMVWAALGVSCLLAVVGYVVSRTFGLPLMADDIGNWFETLGVIAVVSETAVVATAAAALLRHHHSSRA